MDAGGKGMVNDSRVPIAIQLIQLVAVLGVCFNHWSITLLKGSPSVFSAAAYREPAMFGLVFLFVSSGFLTQWHYSEQLSANEGEHFRLDFMLSRYWRLVLPVAAAITFDYFLQGFADQSQTKDVVRALPFLLTLTQTWHYSVLGATSLAEPAGGSNMAWLGANLFFLSVMYGVTAPLWNRIKSKKVLSGILVFCGIVLAGYLSLIEHLTPQINSWAALKYGSDLQDAYSLSPWLIEYCPYVNLPAFLAGIAIARFIQISNSRQTSWIFVSAICYAFFIHNHAAYMGWSVAICILIARWIAVTPDAQSRWSIFLSPSGLAARLGACAYEVYVLHLLIYLAFTLATLPSLSAYGVALLFGRVVVVNLLMVLLCVGFAEVYFSGWQRRITTWLGLRCFREQRYA